MNARQLPHVDLVAYLLGTLEAPESARVERHLNSCALCSVEIAELRPAARLLERPRRPCRFPLISSSSLAAVARAAGAENGRVTEAATRFGGRPDRPRRPLAAAVSAGAFRHGCGIAAVLAAAVFAGSMLSGDDLPGSLELDATLAGMSGQSASAVVQKTESAA